MIGALLSGVATAALAQAPVSTAPRSDAASASADAKIAVLEAELEALKAQVQDLKASSVAELKDVRDVATAKPAASVSITNGRPGIASSDGRFTANFHVVTQL